MMNVNAKVKAPYVLTPLESEVAKLWQQGSSANQIGRKVGKTRASVVSTIHKLRRHGFLLRAIKGGASRTSEPKVKKQKPAVEAPPVAEPIETLEEEEEGVDGAPPTVRKSFIDRQPSRRAPGQLDIPFDGTSRHCCQWPAWSIDTKKGDMCGLPVNKKFPVPYCSFHYGLAYNPPKSRNT